MEEQMQVDVETIFENFKDMYESCVLFSQKWPDNIEATASYLRLVADETTNMSIVFSGILEEYATDVDGSINQGKLFNE